MDKNDLVKKINTRREFVRAFGCRMAGDEILLNGTTERYIEWLKNPNNVAPHGMREN